jgi:serine/threonine protein kinase
MEYLAGGSLLDLMNRMRPTISDVLRIFSQLVCALHYLHHRVNFVHRDIKMENVLFDEQMNVRLIDLSLGKMLEDRGSSTTTFCGSLPYCAPEILQHSAYGKQVDIWSLGICLYGMTLGRLPFESEVRGILMDQICTKEPEIPVGTPPLIFDLMSRMLRKEPEARITIEEITQHPWIRGSVWTIYFEKAFQTINSFPQIERETKRWLGKHGFNLDTVKSEDDEDGVVVKIQQRKVESKIAAHPEILVTGWPRHGFSLPTFPILSSLKLSDTSVTPVSKISLLDSVHRRAGVIVTRKPNGQGRIHVRHPRRASGGTPPPTPVFADDGRPVLMDDD